MSASSWFSCGSSILVELELGDVGFCERRKNREPGEKPSKQGKNQQQTQPTCDNGQESNQATLMGGEHSHYCVIPACCVSVCPMCCAKA